MRSAIVMCVVAVLAFVCLSSADVPPYFSYQGVLKDGSGVPVPDGEYDVTFSLYDVESGGTALWTESQTLTAEDGIINATLGTVVTLQGVEFDVPYWLGISIEGEAELTPRTAILTAPYAGHAAYADRALEADEDWQVEGDDIYHELGSVGIGLMAEQGRLDVYAVDERCARFRNSSADPQATITGVNSIGTAGAFYSAASPSSYPSTPAAVWGCGGTGSTGGLFYSDTGEGVLSEATYGNAIHGYSPYGHSGYFAGGGLGVYVDDLLETNAFRMTTDMNYGYVLTCDGSGYGTWQAPAAVPDGDWTVAADDVYLTPSGRVGIGLTLPTAKLEIYNDTSEEALEVKYGGTAAGRAVNVERTTTAASGDDLLQLNVTSDSAYDCQLIEANRGGEVVFAVDGDGWLSSQAGAIVNGPVYVNSMLNVVSTQTQCGAFQTSSVTDLSRAVTGTITGTGSGTDPVGVSGAGVPADGWGIGGFFEGGYMGVRGQVTPTGNVNYYGTYGIVQGGSGNNFGVYGYALDGDGNYGVYGAASGGSSDLAGFFLGDVELTGTLYGGSKAFKIDHPLDPENEYLVHTSVESDEMVNVYSGNVTLDGRGEALVEMPDWFEALNTDFRYQLTAIGAPGPNLYIAEKISGNAFRIAGGEPSSEVSWQVTGVRHDPFSEAHRTAVEQPKRASDVGKYIHPEAYGEPRSAGIGYVEPRQATATSAEASPKPKPRERITED